MTGAKKENQFCHAWQLHKEIFEFNSFSGSVFMTDFWKKKVRAKLCDLGVFSYVPLAYVYLEFDALSYAWDMDLIYCTCANIVRTTI